MFDCNIGIFDLDNTLKMTLACLCIITGVLLDEILPIKIIGFSFYLFGWMFVGYNFSMTMPENSDIFWPAILTIIVSSLVFKLGYKIAYIFYSLAWIVLGYISTNHLDGNKKYLGFVASIGAILSSNFLDQSIGISGYTASLCLLILVYGLPTFKSLENDLPDCLQQIPLLAPYTEQLKCILNSACLKKPLGTSKEDRLKGLANIFECLATKCNIKEIQQIVDNFDCFANKGCFDDIIASGFSQSSIVKAIGCAIGTNCTTKI